MNSSRLASTSLAVVLAGGLVVVARAQDALPAGVVAKLPPPQEGAHPKAALFSPDGKSLATVFDKKIHVWDTETWKEVRALEVKDSDMPFAWAPDGKTFASLAGSSARNADIALAVTIYDAQSGEEKLTLKLSEKTRSCPVHSILFTPDGKRLLAVGERSTTGPILWGWDVPAGGAPDVCGFGDAGDSFISFACSPDGKTLAAAAEKGQVVLIDLSHPEKIKELIRIAPESSYARCVAFSTDGKLFATGGFDRPLCVYETATGNKTADLGHRFAGCVFFLPDGTLVSGDKEQFCCWDVSTKKCKGIFGRKGKVEGLEPKNSSGSGGGAEESASVSPSGKLIAWSVDSEEWGTVYVFDVATILGGK